MVRYQVQKAELLLQHQDLKQQVDQLKAARKNIPKRIAMKDLAEGERFQRLLPERKHFIDTIKMIAYRAETSMVSVLRAVLARHDDARALVRRIFHNEVDLKPDLIDNTLTVRLHHLGENIHDAAVRSLCDQLNATATVFPGTTMRLIYELVPD